PFSQYTLTAVMKPCASAGPSTESWSPTANLGDFTSSPFLKNLVLLFRLNCISRWSCNSSVRILSSISLRVPRKLGNGALASGLELFPLGAGIGTPRPLGYCPGGYEPGG